MKRVGIWGLAFLILLMISSCTANRYEIRGSDVQISADCKASSRSLQYSFDPSVPRQIHSIDSQRRIPLENTSIDLADILEMSECVAQSGEQPITVQVHSYQHKSGFSHETGFAFVAVKISISAAVVCRQGVARSVDMSHLSNRFRTKFMGGGESIQRALTAATYDAANGLTDKLQAYCEE